MALPSQGRSKWARKKAQSSVRLPGLAIPEVTVGFSLPNSDASLPSLPSAPPSPRQLPKPLPACNPASTAASTDTAAAAKHLNGCAGDVVSEMSAMRSYLQEQCEKMGSQMLDVDGHLKKHGFMLKHIVELLDPEAAISGDLIENGLDIRRQSLSSEHIAGNMQESGAPHPVAFISQDGSGALPLLIGGVNHVAAVPYNRVPTTSRTYTSENGLVSFGSGKGLGLQHTTSRPTFPVKFHTDMTNCSVNEETDDDFAVALSPSGEANGNQEKETINFEVRQEWRGEIPLSSYHKRQHRASMSQQSDYLDHTHSDLMIWYRNTYRKLILHPASKKRFVWELLSFAAVLYELVVLPLKVFDPPDEAAFFIFMGMLTQVFWTLDLVVNFHCGFYAVDEVVMNPGRIALKYLKGWFAFDVAIVGVAWLDYFMQAKLEGIAALKSLKMFRTLRAVRSVRLLRIMKLAALKNTLEEGLSRRVSNPTLYSVGRFVGTILVIVHFLSCAWYGVGLYNNDEGWVIEHDLEDQAFNERYLLTFHWTLTQFGFGESDISGTKATELLVNIVIILMGLLFTAFLVSSITNTFSTIQQSRQEQARQYRLLRVFCFENDFSRSLTTRVLRHVEREVQTRRKRIELDDVTLLCLLSGPLHAEVMYTIYAPGIQTHPFLNMLIEDTPYVVQQVAAKALSVNSVSTSDVVFFSGSLASKAFFIISGSMSYAREGDFDDQQDVAPTVWLSEAVLWTHWIHVGDLRAATPSRCMAIDAAKFCSQISLHTEAWRLASTFAKDRVLLMSRTPRYALSDVASTNNPQAFPLPKRGTFFDMPTDAAENLARQWCSCFKRNKAAKAAASGQLGEEELNRTGSA